MKPNPIRLLIGCLSLLCLLISTPTTVKTVSSHAAGPLALSQAYYHEPASPTDIPIPGLKDTASLLARAGIPKEVFQPSSMVEAPAAPLDVTAYQWHTFYGSAGDYEGYNANDYGKEIAYDSHGGIYIIGYSTQEWYGPLGQLPLHANSGGGDLTILKLDAAGNYQWHTFFGSDSNDLTNGLAVDDEDGVYITGYSHLAWSGPEGQAPRHAHSGYSDIAILKLDASGNYLWHTFYGAAYDDYSLQGSDISEGIAVDGSGGVYVTGHSDNTWNGPNGQVPLHRFTGGDNDLFVLKLNTAGDYQWHTFFGSIMYDRGVCLTEDGNGWLYIAGSSENTWNGPAGQPPLNPYSGTDEIAVIKLDSAGTYQWHTFYGSPDPYHYDYSYGIATDSDGGVYITGESSNTWDGPSGQPPLHAFIGSPEILVLKLNAAGAYQWHTFIGSEYADIGNGIAMDSSGGVYITGLSYDTWSGPSGQAPLHAHSGYCDIVVFKLDAAGSYQWHTFYGLEADGYMTQGSDSGNGIAVDSSGNIYIAGGSNGSWNGPGGEPPLHEFMIDLFITYYEGYHDITVLKLKTGIHADDYMNLPLVFNSSE